MLAAPARKKSGHVEMSDTRREFKAVAAAPFYVALKSALMQRQISFEAFCPNDDVVARRVLEEYGAIFVASDKVLPPPVCVFTSEAEVTKFQNEAGIAAAVIAGAQIELQPAAMEALLTAREQALAEGLNITPRGGTEAARRSFQDTLYLWDTRFLPALVYWHEHGQLTDEEVAHLRRLPVPQQIGAVLELEKKNIFFSKDFSKSILYSVAAPGASQHLSMLAFDVTEFENEGVREILAQHGWFQTVLSDRPHFTFLGLPEQDLSMRGLKPVEVQGQVFWIPNVNMDN